MAKPNKDRRAVLEQMRREITPLARRLATRVSKQKHKRGRGPLDFRRTVRSSLARMCSHFDPGFQSETFSWPQ